MIAFYEVPGFGTTYRQRKPNPYASLRREDLHLRFFEIAGFDPAASYGSCLVLTRDTGAPHRAFTAGMRAAYGKVLVAGTRRMTRLRPRRNAGGVSGFRVIDPGEDAAPPAGDPAGRLAKALANAVVLADSRGGAPRPPGSSTAPWPVPAPATTPWRGWRCWSIGPSWRWRWTIRPPLPRCSPGSSG